MSPIMNANANIISSVTGTGGVLRLVLSGILMIAMAVPAMANDSIRKSGSANSIEFGYPDQTVFVTTTDTQGRLENPMIRLATVMMDKAGFSCQSKAYPAKRLFANLESGVTPLSFLVRVPDLQDSCLFSSQPIYKVKLNVYHLDSTPKVTSKEDLKGNKLITIHGYSYGGLMEFIGKPENNIKISHTRTHEAAFTMLSTKRGDYLLDYEPVSSHVLSLDPIEGIQADCVDELAIYIVLSKAYPGAADLMAKLEEIISRLDVEQIISKKMQ